MFTQEELLNCINGAIDTIAYPQSPFGLYEPIKYTLHGGGKRIRPVLTLATCTALGGNLDTSLNQALGIEMFHNFTLLHDDVMDNADVRRGRPTVHKKWNESTAILSGDTMLTMATQLVCKCCDSKLCDVIKLFNQTAIEVYEGQQYDMDFESRNDVAIEEYIEMIRLKTSVLLGCACKMGALMAGANDEICQRFYNYGVKLGLAFQLQDDYLDTYGDPKVFGKNIGGDILNDKKTWLLISAMKEDEIGELTKFIGNKNVEPQEKIHSVRAIYDKLNLAQRCHDLIDQYAQLAIAELENVDIPDESKDFFVNLALKSCRREN